MKIYNLFSSLTLPKFTGPVFEAKKFYFSMDSKVQSATHNFWEALAMLFTSYFVFLKYPAAIGNTMEFYQR